MCRLDFSVEIILKKLLEKIISYLLKLCPFQLDIFRRENINIHVIPVKNEMSLNTFLDSLGSFLNVFII
ncbi:Protein of unknown function [Gryllus bimaculatus]|nr:Protein of unknown function [Gryllus bimaculatus]